MYDFDKIPTQLKQRDQWISWLGVPKENGKIDRVPVDAKTGNAASTTDPATWTSFDEAVAFLAVGTCDGVGYVLTEDDPFTGVDLDDCADAYTGEIADWAQEIVDNLNSYAELSPSGTGIHIFVEAKKPGERCRKGDVEIYEKARYLTVTGYHIDESPLEIHAREQELADVYTQFFGDDTQTTALVPMRVSPTHLAGDDLIQKAMEAANGEKFKRLWEGDISEYESQSHADLAFCSMLAFWTSDTDEIDRLFRKSGLYRDKWDREDYSKRTIEKALQQTSYYQPRSERGVYEDAYSYAKVSFEEGTMDYLSSFIIKPKVRIWTDGTETVKADIHTKGGRSYQDVVFQRNDWNSKERFMNALPSVDLVWYGSINDVQAVQRLVANYQVTTKDGTTRLGFYQANTPLWILPDGTAISADGREEDPSVVYLPMGGRGELDDKISYPHLDEDEYQQLAQVVYTELLDVNESEAMIPVVGWFCAAPFKSRFDDKYQGFPLLCLHGTRGAGKSTLLRLMWKLFGFSGSKLFSCTETDFVSLKLLSSTTSIPICMDEYKPYDMPERRLKALHRLLRRCYNGESEFRGRPDQTTVEYSLSAPVAIAGEVALTESALLERILSVNLSPNSLGANRKSALARLQALELQGFCDRYIPFVLATDFETELARAEEETARILGDKELPERVRRNLVVMVFGIQQFCRFGEGLELDLDDFDAVSLHLLDSMWLPGAIERMVEAVCGEDGITKTALDYLLEQLSVMAETGRLSYGVHYTIKADEDLAIRLDSCLAEFRRFARETQLDTEVLNTQAYKQQIRENQDRGGYVRETSQVVRMGSNNLRCVLIDVVKAREAGLDLSGFQVKRDDW